VGTWTRFVIGFAALSVLSFSSLLTCMFVLPSRRLRIRVGNLHGKLIGRLLLAIAGSRPVLHGREIIDEAKPAIYLCNHESVIDLFISIWLCPMGGCGVAKHEIVRVPFFGWAWWLSGHLLLKRQNRKSAIAAMNSITDEVKRYGMSVWLLPEGTRSRDGSLLEFKKGFVHLALNTGLPVVPVVVHGAGRRWPADELKLYPGELHIEVLDAVPTTDWTLEKMDDQLALVRDQFAVALERGEPLPAALEAPSTS
jgi:1-acyl-sn-glycerol-3-phosphate acyltransferase